MNVNHILVATDLSQEAMTCIPAVADLEALPIEPEAPPPSESAGVVGGGGSGAFNLGGLSLLLVAASGHLVSRRRAAQLRNDRKRRLWVGKLKRGRKLAYHLCMDGDAFDMQPVGLSVVHSRFDERSKVPQACHGIGHQAYR